MAHAIQCDICGAYFKGQPFGLVEMDRANVKSWTTNEVPLSGRNFEINVYDLCPDCHVFISKAIEDRRALNGYRIGGE